VRNAFIGELLKAAGRDPEIFLVVGDLGYSVVEPFAEQFPSRFLNVGVAEQNMTGIAAGLAREGYKVFTYSIANFPTLRCLEQVRNDVCYHNIAVTMVAVGAGFMYGTLGASHHATEDIGILRTLPNLRVYAPCATRQLPGVLAEIVEGARPSYLRLGRAIDSVSAGGFEPASGGWLVSLKRADRAIVVVGNVLPFARTVLEGGAGGSDIDHADIWLAGRLKPLPGEILDSLSNYREVIVFEDHQRQGGVYSIIAESLYNRAVRSGGPFLKSYAIPGVFPVVAGKEAYLQAQVIERPVD
jgi:transketolase